MMDGKKLILLSAILDIFKQNKNPISTTFSSKELDMPHRQIIKRLNRLQQDKYIVNVGRISNRSFLWNLNGGILKLIGEEITSGHVTD